MDIFYYTSITAEEQADINKTPHDVVNSPEPVPFKEEKESEPQDLKVQKNPDGTEVLVEKE